MRKVKYQKFLYGFLLVFLYESGVFAASDTTKQLIHKYLAKYGITSNKQDCNTDKEPKYDKRTGKVKCNEKFNNKHHNNYWSPSDRLCKECPYGTILNKNTYQSCNEIKCQYGMELTLPNNKKCPEGYELIKITNGNCPEGFERVLLNEKCPEGYERFNNK